LRRSDRAILLLLTPPAIVLPGAAARAVQYLDVSQAQRTLFADATRFEPVPVTLSDDQRRSIAKSSATRTPIPTDRIWRALRGDELIGHVIVDEVYGKHEFITYAVAIDPTGAVLGVEIMDYRETHGGEVRRADWRSQFRGKRIGEPFDLGEDIVNISGATMSCKHIADGVKRVLALYALAIGAP
jgi:Na+-translocating ferredoxin:NAD+ oxidoreductase RnfG subunit